MWRILCKKGLVGVWVGLLVSVAHAETTWQLQSPAQDNSAKVVMLTGQGVIGKQTFPVLLSFSCQSGTARPRMVLNVPILVEDWDFRAYDTSTASGGAQRRSVLSVRIANRRILERPAYTAVAENKASFMFDWQPNARLLQRLDRANDTLTVNIRGVRRGQGQFVATFVMPADASLLREVLLPCSPGLADRRKEVRNGQ